jgi:hypothetical protein
MKKKFKILASLVALITLPFFVIQCDGSKEKIEEKNTNAQTDTGSKKETNAQSTSMLPKKLLNLGLTEEQIVKCEAAYNEIFTPEVIAQQEEMYKKHKSMEEYERIEKEILEKSQKYNDQFNEKLKTILTKEQQDQYFAKKKKNQTEKPVKPVKSGAEQMKNELPDGQYEVVDTPFGKIKRPIKKENQ